MITNINFNSKFEKFKSQLDNLKQHLPFVKMMTHFERECIACLLLEHDTGLGVVEFGTWQGLTTGYMARVLPHAPITTIDISKEILLGYNLPAEQGNEVLEASGVGTEYYGVPNYKEQIKQIIADSLKVNLKDHISSCDFSLIDGNHSYEGVKNDCSKSLEVMRDGGCLILHDLDMRRYIEGEEWKDEGLSCHGVIKYIKENLDKDWYWIGNTALIYRIK